MSFLYNLKHIDFFEDYDSFDDYKEIKPTFIDEKQAIAIANNNLTLKTSLNKKILKNNSRYGLITFERFKIKLVRVSGRLAWIIKVVYGEWGSTDFIKIPLVNKYITKSLSDGDFDEKSNICCLVMVEDGEYIFVENEKDYDIKPAKKREYYDLIEKDKRKYDKQVKPDEEEVDYNIEW